MEREWRPPSIKAYTGTWTVDPAFSARYSRYAEHGSAVMRAAALGLLYTHFLPVGSAERGAYFKAIRDKDKNVQVMVFRTASALPIAFRRRLRREIVGQVRKQLRWLARPETKDGTLIEARALLDARNILDLATLPLRLDGSYCRVWGALNALDAEIQKRSLF